MKAAACYGGGFGAATRGMVHCDVRTAIGATGPLVEITTFIA